MRFRSLLYVPGNDPAKISDTLIFDPDIVVLDLEDSVPESEKDCARLLVRNALTSLPFERPVFVRTNSFITPHFEKDLSAVIDTSIAGLRIPKVDDKTEMIKIDELLTYYEKKFGLEPGKTKLIIGIESARGLMNLEKIVNASGRIIGIAPGYEDLSTDLRSDRNSREFLNQVRFQIVVVARAAGIAALDGVFSNIKDIEGLERDARDAKVLGMDGKSAVHPDQIKVINNVFLPSSKELHFARRVVAEYENLGCPGAFNFEGKMIDKPILERYRRILEMRETLNEQD